MVRRAPGTQDGVMNETLNDPGQATGPAPQSPPHHGPGGAYGTGLRGEGPLGEVASAVDHADHFPGQKRPMSGFVGLRGTYPICGQEYRARGRTVARRPSDWSKGRPKAQNVGARRWVRVHCGFSRGSPRP